MSAEVVRVLTLAQTKVQYRWIQGAATDNQGGVCSQAAVNLAASELTRSLMPCSPIDLAVAAMETLMVAIQRTDRTGWPTIPNWNDYHFRTKQEVLDAFTLAIRIAGGEVVEKTPVPVVEKVVIPPDCVPTSIFAKVKDLVGV